LRTAERSWPVNGAMLQAVGLLLKRTGSFLYELSVSRTPVS
jgi:hypothetical protein